MGGFLGEQFALPEALELLRSVRKVGKDGEEIQIAAADPLNLLGIVLPGPRLSALSSENLRLRDGVPFDPSELTTLATALTGVSRISV